MDSIPSADNIRVLIKTTGYTALTHDYVTVSSKSPFYVIYFEMMVQILLERRKIYIIQEILLHLIAIMIS